MTRLAAGQFRSDTAQQIPHDGLGFANRKTANRETWKRQAAGIACALLAQFWLEGSLHDAKQRLFWSILFFGAERTFGPAMGPLHSLPGGIGRTGIGGTDIQWQDDIRAKLGLDLHDTFRRQHMRRAIQV